LASASITAAFACRSGGASGDSGGGHHGQSVVGCWSLVKVGVQRSNLENKYLINSLIVKSYLFAYSGDEQNHKALPENTKDTIKKNVPKGSFVYLRICFRVKEITA
jgi:hypothetical protein